MVEISQSLVNQPVQRDWNGFVIWYFGVATPENRFRMPNEVVLVCRFDFMVWSIRMVCNHNTTNVLLEVRTFNYIILIVLITVCLRDLVITVNYIVLYHIIRCLQNKRYNIEYIASKNDLLCWNKFEWMHLYGRTSITRFPVLGKEIWIGVSRRGIGLDLQESQLDRIIHIGRIQNFGETKESAIDYASELLQLSQEY